MLPLHNTAVSLTGTIIAEEKRFVKGLAKSFLREFGNFPKSPKTASEMSRSADARARDRLFAGFVSEGAFGRQKSRSHGRFEHGGANLCILSMCRNFCEILVHKAQKAVFPFHPAVTALPHRIRRNASIKFTVCEAVSNFAPGQPKTA